MKASKIFLFAALFSFGASSLVHSQTISTLAGTGVAGYSGDAGPSTTAQVNVPHGVATDAAGNIYITDYNNHRIRKVSTTGVITTIAGTGFGGYFSTHEGVPATTAWIEWPTGIAVDAAENVYFSDFGNNAIRKISSSGIITTLAGIPDSPPGYSGDGGPATAAVLNGAWGIAVDASGDILIADALNNRIRKVTVSTGIISTIAGMGFVGFGGDGGLATATACRLNEPTGVAVDATGNIYIADYGNNRIRKINTSGIITTIAGLGLPYGYTGDGGPASAARFYSPKGIAVDNPGNIYICDWNNHAIRKISTTGIINTVAGTGVAGYGGDGGPALAGQLNRPTGIAVRYDGDLFIADNDNNRVRRIKIGNDPYFTSGLTRNLTICPGEFSVIDSVLSVDDIDVGQTLTWSPALLPAHATLVTTYTATSTGSTVTPIGSTYAPHAGYSGPDTFKVRVTDGTYSDIITLYVTILPMPNAGVITGPDTVCPGLNILLADTVAGGTWSSSNTSIATVTSGGSVTGIVPGTATITYTFSNLCGTALTTRTVTVLATVPCVSSIQKAVKSESERIIIAPNPSTGVFNISVPSLSNEIATVEIMNVTGARIAKYNIMTNKDSELTLDQPSGLYFVYIYLNGNKLVRKLCISK